MPVSVGQQSVLPEARHREINVALGKILRTRAELDRAERCGYDASHDRAELDAFEAMFTAWKREYFGHLP